LEELFTVFDLDICLAVACDGVLNSSVFCQTTHTHTGHTSAEHYNSYHQTLIGAIISTISDLSIQIMELINISFERISVSYPVFNKSFCGINEAGTVNNSNLYRNVVGSAFGYAVRLTSLMDKKFLPQSRRAHREKPFKAQ